MGLSFKRQLLITLQDSGCRQVKSCLFLLKTLTRGKFILRIIAGSSQTSNQCPLCKRRWENALEDIGGGPRRILYSLKTAWSPERRLKVKLTEPPVTPRLILGNHIELISPWMTHCKSMTPHLSRGNKPRKKD